MPATLEEGIAEKNTAAPAARKMTFEEFINWAVKQEFSYEWVDGMVVPKFSRTGTEEEGVSMAAAPGSHGELLWLLGAILRIWVRRHHLGWVMGPEFAMKLDAQRRGREPDLLFVTADRMNLIRDNYLDGAADMAVEIISPESIGRDRGEKFVEYEAAGVREYWLLDPIRQQAEFYRLGDDGHYRLVSTEPDGIFRSQIIAGFWLRVEWLWNLPDEFEVLQELGIR